MRKVSKEDNKSYYERKCVGRVVELIEAIDDPYTPKPIGSKFYVESVDDIFQLHGYWLDGGSMAIDTENDKFWVI